MAKQPTVPAEVCDQLTACLRRVVMEMEMYPEMQRARALPQVRCLAMEGPGAMAGIMDLWRGERTGRLVDTG